LTQQSFADTGNEYVIPALCRKAGIPESDSRGALTGHRARATIATSCSRE